MTESAVVGSAVIHSMLLPHIKRGNQNLITVVNNRLLSCSSYVQGLHDFCSEHGSLDRQQTECTTELKTHSLTVVHTEVPLNGDVFTY